MTHEYRRFVQSELDARGWEPAELVRRSGLRRQLIWKILHDDRDALGQMPDEATMEGLARGLGIPVDRVRLAAARSLDRYVDDTPPTALDVRELPIDVLLEEIRRRIPSDNVSRNKSKDTPNWGRGVGPRPPAEDPRMGRDQQSG